jgi:hypothetical protein
LAVPYGDIGGGEDEPLDPVRAAGLDQPDAAQDVHPGVEDGVLDRSPYADLGGQVADRVRLLALDNPIKPAAVELHLVEVGRRGDLVPLAAGEVVDDHQLVTLRDQPVPQVGADEPGAAGYKDLHPVSNIPPIIVAAGVVGPSALRWRKLYTIGTLRGWPVQTPFCRVG